TRHRSARPRGLQWYRRKRDGRQTRPARHCLPSPRSARGWTHAAVPERSERREDRIELSLNLALAPAPSSDRRQVCGFRAARKRGIERGDILWPQLEFARSGIVFHMRGRDRLRNRKYRGSAQQEGECNLARTGAMLRSDSRQHLPATTLRCGKGVVPEGAVGHHRYLLPFTPGQYRVLDRALLQVV